MTPPDRHRLTPTNGGPRSILGSPGGSAYRPEQWERASQEQGRGEEHGEALAMIEGEGVRSGEHEESQIGRSIMLALEP
jgi:hypothetical protein